MASVPPLTWLAVVAGMADLFINRIALPAVSGTLSRDTFLALERYGTFARNVAVVSALVALVFCLIAFASKKGRLPLSTRVGVVAFGWTLVPIVTLMTVLPLGWTRIELVYVVSALSHALILLLILAGIHWRSTYAIASALALLLVAYVSGIASLAVSRFGERLLWDNTDRLAAAFRWSGEIAYLAIPVAVAVVVAASIEWRTARGRWTLVAAAAVGGLTAAAFLVWLHVAGDLRADLFYTAFRLDLVAERDMLFGYVAPITLWVVVVVAAIASADTTVRQLGAALLILLCAGYLPRSPASLVMAVLGVTLVSRTALSRARRRIVESERPRQTPEVS